MREVAIYGMRSREGGKYILLRETGKPDVRVPVADDADIYGHLRDLMQTHGPANFTIMNDVGKHFGRKLRAALLTDLIAPTESKQ